MKRNNVLFYQTNRISKRWKMKKDTIAAISTGMTNSGIGIVRISGEEAFAIIDRIYKGKEQLSQAESHTIHYGFIKDREETIDEVLVSVMRAPRTFTGEDTVEMPWRNICGEKGSGNCDQKRGQTGRTGRIYQARIFEWKDGSFPGRGGDRCNHISE